MSFKNVKNYVSLLLVSGMILSFLALTACGGGGGGGGEDDDTKSFKAYNMVTNSVYSVDAVLVYNGAHCSVYREKGAESYMSDTIANQMGEEFDNNIYDKIIDNFGSPSDVDSNGKITLLILDIKDGYSGSGGYVAGYFDPVNEYDTSSEPDSNEADMLYMDSYPGASDSAGFKQTMAHEFQHLVNFNQKVFVQGFPAGFDTWINEGMSSAAEKIYSDSQIQWKINYYNNDPYGEIAQGQNFVAWGNDSYSSDLGNYATVYLFFQWLSIQGGGDSIYKAILNNDSYSDYRAVYDEMVTATGCTSFGDLLRSWFIANLLNQGSGLYGYKGNITTITVNYLDDLTGYPAAGTTNYILLPGEGVYLHTSGSHTTTSSSPVFNAGITTAGTIDLVGPDYTGQTLLCYNINGRSTNPSGTTGAIPNVLSKTSSKILKSTSFDNNIYPIDVVFNEQGKPSLDSSKISNKKFNKALGMKLN